MSTIEFLSYKMHNYGTAASFLLTLHYIRVLNIIHNYASMKKSFNLYFYKQQKFKMSKNSAKKYHEMQKQV